MLCLKAYDTLLTFDLEVNLIWKAQWNVMKVLFILTRYLPFFDTTISISMQFLRHASVAECEVIYASLTWVLFIGMAFAEAILTIRTWAVCGSKKFLGISLSILFIIQLGAQIGPIYMYWKS
ncbi:hypothetical protein BDQ17DRAFT_1299412, partial [Cyathus striatus]